MSAVLTQHAIDRGNERLNIGTSSMAKMAQRALDSGYRQGDVSGRFKRYLDGLYFKNRTANGLRVYGENVYVFSGSTLVTVFPLPHEFRAIVAKLNKRKSL